MKNKSLIIDKKTANHIIEVVLESVEIVNEHGEDYPDINNEERKAIIKHLIGLSEELKHTEVCPKCFKSINPKCETCPYCEKNIVKGV